MSKNAVRRVSSVGTCHYVTLPKEYLAYLGIVKSDYVIVELQKDHIIIRKLKDDRK